MKTWIPVRTITVKFGGKKPIDKTHWVLDDRSIEERVCYKSFNELWMESSSSEYQEGWLAAMDGLSGEKNPYALSVEYKKAKQVKYEDGSWSTYPDTYPIQGGKERVDRMLAWMHGYNAWVKMFNGKEAGWVWL